MPLSPTRLLSERGVSIWLDYLSRDAIRDGRLKQLIHHKHVVGVTTNPTIFESAFASTAYESQLKQLAARRFDVLEVITELTVTDVADAATILGPVFERTHGVDGRVSIEVRPQLAHDATATIAEAKHLWARVNRPNAMIKIPATESGLDAITATIADGICVNVTLLFGLDRYRDVIRAYLKGLELAETAGHDISRIHSVASFFVSRVDTEVDRRLRNVGTPEALALLHKTGIANARLAYQLHRDEFASTRAQRLLALGAHAQRPLWASTGTKDAALSDTAYVTELIAPGVVNTMPPATLDAVEDHGIIASDTISGHLDAAMATVGALADVGVSYREVTARLEEDGLQKFTASWQGMEAVVAEQLDGRR
ncbi:transaldolase [Diaminobutyricibacter tongyongensis]|uniref:Transaldolase n=1 Tax=Leifsonia tongyongensis TaxID=1268043 RepID=A0A6L9Y293_9MICO|nr:transaldolase [Diaminobutyricibacter tongyongensis]